MSSESEVRNQTLDRFQGQLAAFGAAAPGSAFSFTSESLREGGSMLKAFLEDFAIARDALVEIAARPNVSAMDLARVAQDALNKMGVAWREQVAAARQSKCPHSIRVTFFNDDGTSKTTCQGCGQEVPREVA